MRSLYRHLMRLHPSRFRNRFEEEMLCIFDETAQHNSGVGLVIDAMVSLFRQWVLRSKYRTPAADSTSLADLRLRSQYVHSHTWAINVMWMVGWIIVTCADALIIPGRLNAGVATLAIPAALACILAALLFFDLPRYMRGLAGQAEESAALTIVGDPQRTRIERQRDSLRKWTQHLLQLMVFLLFFWFHFQLLINRMAWPHMDREKMARITALSAGSHSIMPILWFLVFFLYVNKVNRRAARTLQREIDALYAQEKQS